MIWQRLLIVRILKFCQLNCISMEFQEYLKIGSGPVELTEDKKLQLNNLIQLKIFFSD